MTWKSKIESWKQAARRAAKRAYYWWVYGIDAGSLDGSMLPAYGDGKYVSVYQRGPYLDITAHMGAKGTIRLVPYQPNHGVMVEFWDTKGTMQWRTTLHYDKLCRIGQGKEENR